MTNVPLGPGGWHYDLGHRICITGLGAKATKTRLQAAFGDYGHIIKIETPLNGTAVYISYKDKRDAEDAVKYMDGEKLDGTKITVSRADNRPPIRGKKDEAAAPKKDEKREEEKERKRPDTKPAPRERSRGPFRGPGDCAAVSLLSHSIFFALEKSTESATLEAVCTVSTPPRPWTCMARQSF
ncbi:Rbp1 [Symbiodinium necroappetens]|uniref:Rbp1 protein n=1 Tax=Symbiodinium necroappetens TaxID=1628268 RepID=A0A812KWS4_9DINO|nr:Rbp1 [Symbiodinium necroappetens]